ncbi:MAG: trypsin-like peptidase domain-containing protein [Gemmatimonadetes bacterium]|nr:trypsin-like peptidase domain-containing protein [Gemmatimonadota bacterium]
MKPQIRVLSGFSAGTTAVFSKPYIAIGRHPASDLRFDADKELDVSARHAAILRQGGRWVLRDLGSRNGTLVNGHQITADTKLDDTDQIRLGTGGPTFEFRLVPDSTPDTVLPPPPAGAAQAPRPSVETAPGARGVPRPTAGAASGRTSTSQKIRVEVQRQTKGLRTLTAVLFGVLLLVVAAFVFENRRQAGLREREAQATQARIDSVLAASEAAVQSLRGQVAGLADALRRSQAEVERVNRDLASARASGDAGQVAALRARLTSATETLRNQQLAAQVDYSAIHQANQDAVAMIYVELAPGEVFTGTAFAITRDGVMITNRHVVAGPDGTRRPSRIGIKFADSDQTFAARLLALSPDRVADVAVVKVDIRGGNPAVKSLGGGAGVRPGDPVAIIGFPLGAELPSDRVGGKPVARTSLTAGTVSKVLSDLVQVDGYGAEGSSGSPIFDRAGNVVAILYGGQPGTGGRIVFGVPIAHARQLAAPFVGQQQ